MHCARATAMPSGTGAGSGRPRAMGRQARKKEAAAVEASPASVPNQEEKGGAPKGKTYADLLRCSGMTAPPAVTKREVRPALIEEVWPIKPIEAKNRARVEPDQKAVICAYTDDEVEEAMVWAKAPGRTAGTTALKLTPNQFWATTKVLV